MTRRQIIATQTTVALTILAIVAVGAMTTNGGTSVNPAEANAPAASDREPAPLAQPATRPTWTTYTGAPAR